MRMEGKHTVAESFCPHCESWCYPPVEGEGGINLCRCCFQRVGREAGDWPPAPRGQMSRLEASVFWAGSALVVVGFWYLIFVVFRWVLA